MKKIIGLTVAALLVMGLVGGGTWAYFSDTETSGTNVLSAGTLDLTLGGAAAPFSISNVTPGDSSDPEVAWTLTQSGSISGNLTIAMGTVTNNENTRIEPELAYDASDGADTGELGGLAKIAIWLDNNQANGWDSGDQYLKSDGTVVDWSSSPLPPAAYDTIDSFDSVDWAQPDIATMATTDEFDFMVEYDFPEGGLTDNKAQGDSCDFTITFTLEQA